jgi:hypothetical protein
LLSKSHKAHYGKWARGGRSSKRRRDDETGQAYALKLTAAGTKAIGIDEGAKSENAHNETGALKNRDQVPLSSKAEAV